MTQKEMDPFDDYFCASYHDYEVRTMEEPVQSACCWIALYDTIYIGDYKRELKYES